MTTFNRRHIVKLGSATLVTSLLPARQLFGTPEAAPHFFLQVLVEPGLDPTYLFDARPLAMTQAGLLQNYLGAEPAVWTGANGRATFATSLVEPLRPYFDSFSILNGVQMAAGFDGHEQNKNFLLTGNPFGGEALLPHLNAGGLAGGGTPLDYMQVGTTFGVVLSNNGGSITLDTGTAKALSGPAVLVGGGTDPSDAFISARLAANAPASIGDGLFSEGVDFMRRGLLDRVSLSQRLAQVSVSEAGSDVTKAMALAHQYFKNGITRSAFVVLQHNLDAHDAATAQAQPTTIAGVVTDLGEIFKYLTETPLDGEDGPKLIDVTTLVICSEFGRTMRQESAPDVSSTGTDHNPLSNMVLVGGKGIRKGLILGESDRRTPDEVVSPAHASVDGSAVRFMGKPFDFDTCDTVAGYDPSAWASNAPESYLTYASVANTIYQLFGVDDAKRWLVKRNGPAAKALLGLLS
jgi:hypothetical protein